MSGDLAAFERLRGDALDRLRAWQPPTQDQARLRDDYVRHLLEHPDGMAKAGPPAHLTGGLLVLDDAHEHVLLTLHGKARRWFQVGGHYEAHDESVLAGVTREGAEETGIADLRVDPEILHLDRHELVGAFGRCREHLDVRYLAVAPPGAVEVISEESLDLRWWPVDALPPDSQDELRDLVRAGLDRVGA